MNVTLKGASLDVLQKVWLYVRVQKGFASFLNMKIKM